MRTGPASFSPDISAADITAIPPSALTGNGLAVEILFLPEPSTRTWRDPQPFGNRITGPPTHSQ